MAANAMARREGRARPALIVTIVSSALILGAFAHRPARGQGDGRRPPEGIHGRGPYSRVVESAEVVLVGTVAGVGVLHTLVPDHWAPITVIGPARPRTTGQTPLARRWRRAPGTSSRRCSSGWPVGWRASRSRSVWALARRHGSSLAIIALRAVDRGRVVARAARRARTSSRLPPAPTTERTPTTARTTATASYRPAPPAARHGPRCC